MQPFPAFVCEGAEGSQPFAKIYKAKAKSDGDDIISGVIEQAAQAIVDTVGS